MSKQVVEHIVDGMQICRRCHINKSIDHFWKNKTKTSGYTQYCKPCNNLNHKESRDRKKNNTLKSTHRFTKEDKGTTVYKEDQRNKKLQKAYGIDLDNYNKMFIEQQGCCKICNIHQLDLSRPLDVDHDHNTGKIRGLLCGKCNTGIGLFNDNTETLYNVIKYLQNTNKISIEIGNNSLN